MAKTFADVKREIAERVNAKEKKILSFSRSEYNELGTSILNTPDYSTEVVKMRNGEMTVSTKEPVKEFRSFVRGVLEDFGVDKQEAANVETTYQFKESKTTWLYDLGKAVDSEYMALGKKLDYPTTKTFQGSLSFKTIPETVNTYKAPRTGIEGKIKKEEHTKLIAKSKPSKWLKSKVD